MIIQVLREAAAIQKLAGEWRNLLTEVPQATPFQTPEFHLAWWEHMGGGEWSAGHIYCLVGRSPEGALLGLAPLFLPVEPGGAARLLLLGSHEIADYLDFIAPPQELEAFIHAVLDHLSSAADPQWRSLDLYNLPENSPSLPILETAARRYGWDWQLESLQSAPYIPLPEDWETYLAGLSKKQRHEVRRKMRKAAGYIPPATMHPADLSALDSLFALMRENDQKRGFLSPAMQAQLRAIAKAAADHGWLQLSELRFGQETAAVEVNFDYRGVVWAYNSGSRADYSELSPGVVLHALLIQQAISQGRVRYDFMRGDEVYKFRLGGQAQKVVRATIVRTV